MIVWRVLVIWSRRWSSFQSWKHVSPPNKSPKKHGLCFFLSSWNFSIVIFHSWNKKLPKNRGHNSQLAPVRLGKFQELESCLPWKLSLSSKWNEKKTIGNNEHLVKHAGVIGLGTSSWKKCGLSWSKTWDSWAFSRVTGRFFLSRFDHSTNG